GIDNGCTVSKAGLFTLAGHEVAVASGKSELLCPHPGWQERDMSQMWDQTSAAIHEVITKAGIDPGQIVGVACTGHGNGLYLVDKQGDPVRPAILSTDSRAQSIADQWLADGLDKVVRPKTMQSLWAAQPNTLLAWLLEHEPEVMTKAGWVLMAKDYIRFKLTGKIQAELTDFSATSLMDLNTREYDDTLFKAFGIAETRDLMPPIVRSTDLCGEITEEAAAATGLKAGTPVAGGLFDIDACGLACGVIDDSQLCMVVGTWGNNQYISKTPVVSEDVFMTSCYSLDDYYLMLEGSATSGSNLEWFVTQFFEAEKVQAESQGRSVYDLCNELVASTKPDDSDIIFLPYLYGSNANPAAKATLLGMNAWHGRGHVLRAIYEGVVFGHKKHVERLLQFRDMPDVIRLTGGAARSEVWLQIFADIFQTPVQVPEGTELGALGAAMTAGVAVQCFSNYTEAVKQMVHLTRRIEPNPDLAALYQAKYARYQAVIEALDSVWT
ncbi:MAG: carbohydrate kinase, partial [Phycisphaerae bacterium]|nr:carbohydrate kinase [Phycisphaerae bacterium]